MFPFFWQGVSRKILVEFELLEDGILPHKGTENSAGYDLFAHEERVIAPGKMCLVSLGFKCAIPKGYYGQLKPRSGLALRNELSVDAGVIDSNYRGIVYILLVNDSNDKEFFLCEKGTRVGQIIFHKYENCHFKVVNKLSNTKRGLGGFGSTGLWKQSV